MPVMVYFIQGRSGDPIKVGSSSNPPQRLKEIQSCCPHLLTVLRVTGGGVKFERAVHRRFASLNTHGEWFAESPEFLSFIHSLPEEGHLKPEDYTLAPCSDSLVSSVVLPLPVKPGSKGCTSTGRLSLPIPSTAAALTDAAEFDFTQHVKPPAPVFPEPPITSYVQTLTHWLSRRNITQVELAERSGVPLHRIQLFVKGERPVEVDDAARLAVVLHVASEELMSGPQGALLTGGNIQHAYTIQGTRQSDANPLTPLQWKQSWAELGIDFTEDSLPTVPTLADIGFAPSDERWKRNSTVRRLFRGLPCGFCGKQHVSTLECPLQKQPKRRTSTIQ